jgi:hypothetical protein
MAPFRFLGEKFSDQIRTMSEAFKGFKDSFVKRFLSPTGILGKLIFGLKSIFTSTLSGLFGKGAAERRHIELKEKVTEGTEETHEVAKNTKLLSQYFFDSDVIDDKKTKKFIKNTFKEQRKTSRILNLLYKRVKTLISFFTGEHVKNLFAELFDRAGKRVSDAMNTIKEKFNDFKDGIADAFANTMEKLGPVIKLLNPKTYWNGMKSVGGFFMKGIKGIFGGIAGFFGGIAGWFGGKKKLNREFLSSLIDPFHETLREFSEAFAEFSENYDDAIGNTRRREVEFHKETMGALDKIGESSIGGLKEKERHMEEKKDEEDHQKALLAAIRKDASANSQHGTGLIGDLFDFLKINFPIFAGIIGGISSAIGGVLTTTLTTLGLPTAIASLGAIAKTIGKIGLKLGIAGLAANEAQKQLSETQQKSIKGEDITVGDYGKATVASAVSGAAAGSATGIPGAGIVGGVIGGAAGLAGTAILDATPSQKEAEEASKQAWIEQNIKSTMERLKENEVFKTSILGRDKIDIEKMKTLSLEELKILRDNSELSQKQTMILDKEIERKQALDEQRIKRNKARDEKEAAIPRRKKVEQFQAQKEQAIAGMRAAGKSEEEIARFAAEFDKAIELNAVDTTLNVVDSGIEKIKETTSKTAEKIKESTSSIVDGAVETKNKVKEATSNMFDLMFKEWQKDQQKSENLPEGATESSSNSTFGARYQLLPTPKVIPKAIEIPPAEPLKLDPTQNQSQEFLQGVVDTIAIKTSKEVSEMAMSMNAINNNTSMANNVSNNITVNAPKTTYNNPHGDVYTGIKSSISMNG